MFDIDLIEVVSVVPQEDFKLAMVFSNGDRGVFDVTPYLSTGVFRRLHDEHVFSTAHISLGTVSWDGGIDIAPETLYEKAVLS